MTKLKLIDNELTTIINNGKMHQSKTIEHILAFADCVRQLKDNHQTGWGAGYLELAREHWGLSKNNCSRYYAISQNEKIHVKHENLPTNIQSLAMLAKLSEDDWDKIGVNQSTTCTEIQEYKRALKAPKLKVVKENYVPPSATPPREPVKTTKQITEEAMAKLDEKPIYTNIEYDTQDDIDNRMDTTRALEIFGISGLGVTITTESLKILYKGLAGKRHPDKIGDNKEMTLLNKAYKELK